MAWVYALSFAIVGLVAGCQKDELSVHDSIAEKTAIQTPSSEEHRYNAPQRSRLSVLMDQGVKEVIYDETKTAERREYLTSTLKARSSGSSTLDDLIWDTELLTNHKYAHPIPGEQTEVRNWLGRYTLPTPDEAGEYGVTPQELVGEISAYVDYHQTLLERHSTTWLSHANVFAQTDVDEPTLYVMLSYAGRPGAPSELGSRSFPPPPGGEVGLEPDDDDDGTLDETYQPGQPCAPGNLPLKDYVPENIATYEDTKLSHVNSFFYDGTNKRSPSGCNPVTDILRLNSFQTPQNVMTETAVDYGQDPFYEGPASSGCYRRSKMFNTDPAFGCTENQLIICPKGEYDDFYLPQYNSVVQHEAPTPAHKYLGTVVIEDLHFECGDCAVPHTERAYIDYATF